jgi:hypothetical protein
VRAGIGRGQCKIFYRYERHERHGFSPKASFSFVFNTKSTKEGTKNIKIFVSFVGFVFFVLSFLNACGAFSHRHCEEP